MEVGAATARVMSESPVLCSNSHHTML